VAAAGIILLFGSTSADAHYVGDCGASLAEQWRDKAAARPVSPLKHTIVISIDIPVGGPQKHYPQAIDRLKRAFPSFEEGVGSGILLGCCAIPVWGSVSFDELARLSKEQFVPLCEVGRRSRSTSVGLRVEYRDEYERHIQRDAYFVTYWRSPFRHPRVQAQ
jgi:hypothetical protein